MLPACTASMDGVIGGGSTPALRPAHSSPPKKGCAITWRWWGGVGRWWGGVRARSRMRATEGRGRHHLRRRRRRCLAYPPSVQPAACSTTHGGAGLKCAACSLQPAACIPTLCIDPSMYRSIYVSMYRCIDVSVYVSMYLSINVSMYQCIHDSMYLWINESIHVSTYLSTSIYLPAR